MRKMHIKEGLECLRILLQQKKFICEESGYIFPPDILVGIKVCILEIDMKLKEYENE